MKFAARLTSRLPQFTLPAIVDRIGSRLPQLPPTLALTSTLNLALGRWLPREPLEPLIGKRFTLRVADAGLTLRFAYNERGFHPSFSPEPADLSISAKARDFLALLTHEEDADSLFFSRRLQTEGDTDLGLLVKNTLDAVELPNLDFLSSLPGLRRFLA